MADQQLFFLPSPPRSTGNAQQDYPLIVDWLYKVYNGLSAFVQGQTVPEFNPGTLPDPASSNIATAQATANSAFTLANQAENDAHTAQTTATSAGTAASAASAAAGVAAAAAAAAQSTANTAKAVTDIISKWFAGQVTISDAATSAVHTFSGGEAEANTSYSVLMTATAQTGTPASGSATIISITKTTANITFNVETAPGVGNSVTFDFLALRFT